jgi:uncharacterized short protein YbdD (DUF466 family)
MPRWFTRSWQTLRTLTGDDAYERYRAHHARAHGNEPLLDRRQFYARELDRKWSGVTRCC